MRSITSLLIGIVAASASLPADAQSRTAGNAIEACSGQHEPEHVIRRDGSRLR